MARHERRGGAASGGAAGSVADPAAEGREDADMQAQCSGASALASRFATLHPPTMAEATRLLIVPGSARTGSLNKALAAVAAGAARAIGADVTLIDLRDYPMPIYDGDLEAAQGQPQPARDLVALFREHQAVLFVSPENNASIPSLLKNTIDWMSRVKEADAFGGRVAGLMAASPGGFGGVSGLAHLRQSLMRLNMLVITEQLTLSRAHQAFSADGTLKDAAQAEMVTRVLRRLLDVAARLG